MYNPNNFDISVSEADAHFSHENVPIAHAHVVKKELKAGSVSDFAVTVSVDPGLSEVVHLESAIARKKLLVTIKGNFKADAFPLGIKYPTAKDFSLAEFDLLAPSDRKYCSKKCS